MIKKLLFSIICSLCLLPAFAQHSLLFKVSGKGLKQPSYLYGTIHMLCPDDFKVSDQLKSAFTNAKTLYLEMDMDDPGMMTEMMQLMQGGEGYKLENAFKPGDFAKLKTFLQEQASMNVDMFQGFKPLLVMGIVMKKMLPCETHASYEGTFLTMAKEQQKPVEGLEKMQAQVNVFDQMPDSTEARMIMEYVNDLPKQQAYFAKMVAAYKEQNVEKLHEFLKDSPELSGFEDVMVYDRNRNWIPVIEKAAQQGPALFAFGALHLGGDQGVISLLRKKGYKVEPVKQ